MRRSCDRSGATLCQLGRQVALEVVERHPVLAHRVPITNRHSLVVEGFEVGRDAQRGSDLVLTAVAFTDRLSDVVFDGPQRA